jgi:hypothetical protein
MKNKPSWLAKSKKMTIIAKERRVNNSTHVKVEIMVSSRPGCGRFVYNMAPEICEVHDMTRQEGSTYIVLKTSVQQCVEFLSIVDAAQGHLFFPTIQQ